MLKYIRSERRLRITDAAFDGISDVHRDSGQLALGDSLVIQWER